MTYAKIREDLEPHDIPYIKEGHFEGEQGCEDGILLFKVVQLDDGCDGLNETDGPFNLLIYSHTHGQLRVRSLDFEFTEEKGEV
jgi:hypothetical protein